MRTPSLRSTVNFLINVSAVLTFVKYQKSCHISKQSGYFKNFLFRTLENGELRMHFIFRVFNVVQHSKNATNANTFN